jgi:hypothetical protein
MLILKRPANVLPARIDLQGVSVIVGRGSRAVARIYAQEHPSFLSREHATFQLSEDKWHLVDLNSVNGTSVNLNKLGPGALTALKHGDHIYFGNPHQSFFIEYQFLCPSLDPQASSLVPLPPLPPAPSSLPALPELNLDLSEDMWKCVLSDLTMQELIAARTISRTWRGRVDVYLDFCDAINWDGTWPLAALQALLALRAGRQHAQNRGWRPLRALVSEGSFQLSDISVGEISQLCGPGLRVLDVSGAPHVSYHGMALVARNCPQLETLCVRGCKRVGLDWRWLTQLARNSTLVHVDLHGTTVSDAVIAPLASQCPRLERLLIGVMSAGGVTDFSLRALVAHCPGLQVLDLRGSKLVTDDGLALLVARLPQLHTLILRSCNVGNRFLAAAGASAAQLRRLDLHRCLLVSDAGLRDLVAAQVGAHLTHLDLSNLLVSDAPLLKMAGKCRKLQSLDLRSCKNVTGEGLVRLVGANCQTLRALDISGCVGVPPRAILDVAETCAGVLHMLELGGGAWTGGAAAGGATRDEWLQAVKQQVGPQCVVHAAYDP